MLSVVAKGVAVHFFLRPFFIGTRYGPRAKRNEFVEWRLQVPFPSFRGSWYVWVTHPSHQIARYIIISVWRSFFKTLTWREDKECCRSNYRDFSCWAVPEVRIHSRSPHRRSWFSLIYVIRTVFLPKTISTSSTRSAIVSHPIYSLVVNVYQVRRSNGY